MAISTRSCWPSSSALPRPNNRPRPPSDGEHPADHAADIESVRRGLLRGRRSADRWFQPADHAAQPEGDGRHLQPRARHRPRTARGSPKMVARSSDSAWPYSASDMTFLAFLFVRPDSPGGRPRRALYDRCMPPWLPRRVHLVGAADLGRALRTQRTRTAHSVLHDHRPSSDATADPPQWAAAGRDHAGSRWTLSTARSSALPVRSTMRHGRRWDRRPFGL